MKSLKWMVAGTALLIGAGGAIAQPAETPASDSAATTSPATPATMDDLLAPEAGTTAAASPDKAAKKAKEPR